MPISSIETLRFDHGVVCKFEILTGKKRRIALAYLATGATEYSEIYISPEFFAPECGSKAEVVEAHKLQLGDGNKKQVFLAIEVGTAVDGCCGSADHKDTELRVLNLDSKSGKPLTLHLSNSCTADTECDGRCNKGDKSPIDTGRRATVSWELCEPSCERLEVEYKDLVGNKEKSSKFVSVSLSGEPS